MMGNIGIRVLLTSLFVVVPLYYLPFLLLGAMLRRMFGRRRDEDELRARVVELEAKLEARAVPPSEALQ